MITRKEWAKGLCYEPVFGWFAFYPNGTSDPSLAAVEGPMAQFITSITYSAVGGYVIQFSSDFVFAGTPQFVLTPSFDGLTNYYAVAIDGAYSQTTRQLTVRAHRAGTGQAVAASANAKIAVALLVSDSGGK